jgi:hypothetical protein
VIWVTDVQRQPFLSNSLHFHGKSPEHLSSKTPRIINHWRGQVCKLRFEALIKSYGSYSFLSREFVFHTSISHINKK